MVVLDQDRVVQAHAVVGDAARDSGGLFKRALSRRGLAGVQDFASRAGDRVGVQAGDGRDPAQALEEVEGRALVGEQQARGAGDFGEDFEIGTAIAVALVERQVVIELAENAGPGEDERLPGQEASAGATVCGNAGVGRDVPGPDVLFEREADNLIHTCATEPRTRRAWRGSSPRPSRGPWRETSRRKAGAGSF